MDWSVLIQGFVLVIIIGVVFSLWRTTKAYGGLIGQALKWIGLGMVLFSLEALDRALGDLSFVRMIGGDNERIWHDIILALGLIFSGIGFSKLTKIAK